MSDISPINTVSTRRVGRLSVDPNPTIRQISDDVRGRGGARTEDRAEISYVAKYLSILKSEPSSNTELITRVRDEIKAGTYLTDDKLDAAVNELAGDIGL